MICMVGVWVADGQAGASDALMNAIPAPNDVDDRNWRTRTELPPQEVQRSLL